MKVKTADLIDKPLDYAVAMCKGSVTELAFDGIAYGFDLNGKTMVLTKGWAPSMSWHPSSNWSQGGPIIEREVIDIQAKFNSGSNIVPKGQWYWQASTVNEDDVAYWFDGPTPLIAAMRCYVASKLGDEVEIPEELL